MFAVKIASFGSMEYIRGTSCKLQTRKVQIFMNICTVWSGSSLPAYRMDMVDYILLDKEGLDQTAWKHSMIWTLIVHIWHKGPFVCLVSCMDHITKKGLIWYGYKQGIPYKCTHLSDLIWDVFWQQVWNASSFHGQIRHIYYFLVEKK